MWNPLSGLNKSASITLTNSCKLCAQHDTSENGRHYHTEKYYHIGTIEVCNNELIKWVFRRPPMFTINNEQYRNLFQFIVSNHFSKHPLFLSLG